MTNRRVLIITCTSFSFNPFSKYFHRADLLYPLYTSVYTTWELFFEPNIASEFYLSGILVYEYEV